MINKICQKVNLGKPDTDFIEVYPDSETKFVEIEVYGERGIYSITVNIDRLDKEGTERIFNRGIRENLDMIKSEVEKIERCIRFIKEFLV